MDVIDIRFEGVTSRFEMLHNMDIKKKKSDQICTQYNLMLSLIVQSAAYLLFQQKNEVGRN